jgi:hypothetical protein
MPIDPTKQIANWDTGYDTAAIKTKVDKKRTAMFDRFSSVVPRMAASDLKVKQILDLEGVSVIQYPFYLAFGRELWSLSNKEITGESAAMAAATAVAKWQSRGLTQSVLETIRSGAFDIPRPSTP